MIVTYNLFIQTSAIILLQDGWDPWLIGIFRDTHTKYSDEPVGSVAVKKMWITLIEKLEIIKRRGREAKIQKNCTRKYKCFWPWQMKAQYKCPWKNNGRNSENKAGEKIPAQGNLSIKWYQIESTELTGLKSESMSWDDEEGKEQNILTSRSTILLLLLALINPDYLISQAENRKVPVFLLFFIIYNL